MAAPQYQPSAMPQDKVQAKEELMASLRQLIELVKSTEGSKDLVPKLEYKYGNPDVLYSIYKVPTLRDI